MRILALNAYHGGSHRQFLDGWCDHSRHDLTTLTLPDHHWKWRMRHAAISFAQMIEAAAETDGPWDVIWATDMLNLAELRGLAPAAVGRLPAVLYFHENQLTYPDQHKRDRDLHYAFTNFISAAAADAVWFNSAFHRDQFLGESARWLRSMPDHVPVTAIEHLSRVASVQHPGLTLGGEAGARPDGPIHVLWAARWEADKRPDVFVAALDRLLADGVGFQVSVVGGSGASAPDLQTLAESARDRWGDRVRHWGFVPDRRAYERCLHEADVVVSTAVHEFFGIAVAEAAGAGCVPLVPDALAYPEVFADAAVYHDGTVHAVSAELKKMAADLDRLSTRGATARQAVRRFAWPTRAAAMDDAIEQVVSG